MREEEGEAWGSRGQQSTALGPWAVGWGSPHGDEGLLVPPDLSTQPLSCLVLILCPQSCLAFLRTETLEGRG